MPVQGTEKCEIEVLSKNILSTLSQKSRNCRLTIVINKVLNFTTLVNHGYATCAYLVHTSCYLTATPIK